MSGLTAADLVAEHDEERPSRHLTRRWDLVVGAVCLLTAAVVLRQVFAPFPDGEQYYLIVFLTITLPLIFLCYRLRSGPLRGSQDRERPSWPDVTVAVAAFVTAVYPLVPFAIGDSGGGFNGFLNRQGSLTPFDVAMGTVLMLLVLEACRRVTGVVLPAVCLVFVLYAYYGGLLPPSWSIAHPGFNYPEIVNALYNDASGFYGTPLAVAATYIVLFTIFGAVLDATGAGRFFIDLSLSAFGRSRSAPGRTVTMSGFLLGTVSGSGTATAVSIGSVCWPLLQRAGYPREQAGGMLAAAGIGAILSPPTLGAAAFIIAEYLQTSYLTVMGWAVVPTLLYYLGIVCAVEIDARKLGVEAVDVERQQVRALLLRGGYHFISLGVIVWFLALDIPPFRAVVYAILVAAALGAVGPLASAARGGGPARVLELARSLVAALAQGVRSVLPVVAVCAAAGVITSIITKTGLGQRLAGILVDAAASLTDDPAMVLLATAVLSAVAVAVLGLAVPVTASFIIAWVVIGPALIDVGATAPQAAMFIFYYAVLSEVTPPTALAAVAASAITGGKVTATMWQTCRYTLPAFLVPLAFISTSTGELLLGDGPLVQIVVAALVAGVGVVALAVAAGGHVRRPLAAAPRGLFLAAALALFYLDPWSAAVGAVLLAAALVLSLPALKAKEAS